MCRSYRFPTAMTLQPIDAVVFDVGGVLLDWNPRHLYRKLFADERAMERFLAEVCTVDWHDQHDRGVSYERSCAELAAAHPESAEMIWAWAHRSEEMVAGPIEGTLEVVRELKQAGVPRYLLTNMEAVTWPQRLERFPFLRWFDGAIVSGFEGMAKPDRAIFELLLERFHLAAPRTLFVDDSEANLDTARLLGLETLHFRSPAQLRRRLADAGLLAASPAG
jgi:2-haloacid dehalogenase